MIHKTNDIIAFISHGCAYCETENLNENNRRLVISIRE